MVFFWILQFWTKNMTINTKVLCPSTFHVDPRDVIFVIRRVRVQSVFYARTMC